MTTLLTARSPFSAPLRVLSALVLLLSSLVIALPPLPAQAQSADDGFNPGANEAVAALAVQPDGKILVGGNFATLGGEPCQRIGRLNPDGSLDTTFVDPGTNAQVLAIAVQPDGKILLGGSFTNVAGEIRNHIARLNPNGTLDDGFSPSAAGPVQALVLQPNGKILLGGRFTSGGPPYGYLVRLNPDGSMDTDINLSTHGAVLALAQQPNGKILVGFQVDNDGSESLLIARLNPDGSSDASFQPVLKQGAHYVWSLVLQPDGRILAGGYYFESGVQRGYIARLNADGSLDNTFSSGADGGVLKLALQPDGKIVVAGWFAALAGGACSRIGRLKPDGSLDDTFQSGANGAIGAVALQSDGKILVGGGFTTLGGQARQNIGRLNPDGSPDTTLHAIADGGGVYTIALQPDGKILVGGNFTILGGQVRLNFGRFLPDGTLDTTFDAQADGTVYAIALQSDGKIILGGSFFTLGGEPRTRIGRLNPDGTLDPTFNPGDDGADGPVYGLAVQPDGKILVAGAFRTLGTEAREFIGRLNPDGTVDTTFNAQANSTVHAIALQPDGKIIVGGTFSTLGGEDYTNLGFGRLNPDGSVDPSFGTVFAGYSDTAYAIAQQPDGKIIVGGQFDSLAAQWGHHNIGRLNPDGSPDSGFTSYASDPVHSLVLQPDGKIVAGGAFERLGSDLLTQEERNYIGRFENDGSLDASFNPGADNPVMALASQPDGKIVAGGFFLELDGRPRSRVGRLSADNAALQHLSVSPDASSITWQRSGSGPELWRTTFELSADGLTYTPLGAGTRVSGGWSLDGLSLPVGQSFFVRARGIHAGGHRNGSGSILESVRNSYVQPQAPAISSAAAATLTVGSPASFTVTATGLPTPAISRTGSLPAGVTLTDNGDGTATLSGVPVTGAGGVYPLTIAAANGISPNASQAFTLTVNQPPSITSGNAAAFTTGAGGTFTVTTTGYPTPAVTRSGTLPDGVSFTDNGDGTGTLAGTPAAGAGGTYPLTFTATNDLSPDATQTFTLAVQEKPAITSANAATFTTGTAGSFTVTASGYPTPSLAASGALPTGVVFTDNGDGTATLSGTAAAGAAGVYTLTFTAANSVSPDAAQTFALTVQEAEPPTPSGTTTYLPLALTH